MTPPTVNAYYNPQMNDINFPAGVLQPPLYDPKMDDAPNYGNTGATIGHELTHGFDDEGRQFDAAGNLKDWWTPAGRQELRREGQLRARPICRLHRRGRHQDQQQADERRRRRRSRRNAAGLHRMARSHEGQKLESIDGFTPDQRFFIGMAQWACENERPEELRMNAITEPALAREVSHQRHGERSAGVPAGLWLQGRPADGARKCVQGLVIAADTRTLFSEWIFSMGRG